MSLNSKLRTSFSVAFILTVVGAINVMAQTRSVADNSSPETVARIASTSKPKEAEGAKSSSTSSGNTAPGQSSDGYLGDGPNVIPAANARGTATSAEVRSETTVPQGNQVAPADKWQFQFSPYFWLASLHGTAGVGNRTTQVDESFSDIFHSLDFALMGVLEARKRKFVVLTDLEYVAVSDDKATPGPFFSSVQAKFKTFIFDPEVGYRVFANPEKGQFIDVLGGTRIWHESTELNFRAGILPATQLQGSRTWVDGVVGLRGKAALSKKMFVTAKFDLGGGGSKFTFQVFGGVGYNVNKKVSLIFGYRDLDVNYNKNNFVYDMSQRGPIMGLGFKF